MVHRLGRLEISETSVAVVVTAPHRKPAFDAALEGINRLKKLVPVWKKEYFVDGEVWVDGEWDDAVSQSQIHEGTWHRLGGCVLAALASPIRVAQEPSFKVDVQLVRLLVTVKNPAGDLVGSLESRDFELFRQRRSSKNITVFEHQTTQPLSVTLLIDTSGSMAKDLKFATVSLDEVSECAGEGRQPRRRRLAL